MLFIVSTPIGNLEDMSFRAIRTLQEADLVAAEDTRCTKILFNKYEIGTPLISYHSQSGVMKLDKILGELKAGKNVALVSDAGTPGISDPGYPLISAALEAGIELQAIPGPSAFLTALTVSGFPINRFQYLGFIPHKKGRQTFIENLKTADLTTVFYESSHRIQKLLSQMTEILDSQREICVARELTKKFEEITRGTLHEVNEHIQSKEPKGEYVVVVKAP
ncbi:MAG: 16S rRNA (cytidine(1402)-2'-O)-methyltransferase [Candidatus Gracilibacteria bacterium]|nr:16S rRNA (cytidine(1402)-2'-O)-methyltransferase [Candidatus Gracilibacteria bacterium]